MGRVGKISCLCVGVLLLLCVSKKIDASELAVEFIVPNLAALMEWKQVELPITSEIEKTIVETAGEQKAFEIEETQVFFEQLGEENQLSFETLLEEEETSQLQLPEETFEVAYTEEQLKEYEFLISRIYNVDAGTKTI